MKFVEYLHQEMVIGLDPSISLTDTLTYLLFDKFESFIFNYTVLVPFFSEVLVISAFASIVQLLW